MRKECIPGGKTCFFSTHWTIIPQDIDLQQGHGAFSNLLHTCVKGRCMLGDLGLLAVTELQGVMLRRCG